MATIMDALEKYIPFTASPYILILLCLPALLILLQPKFKFPSNAPKLVKGGWPLLGATQFFGKRWQFYRDASMHAPSGNFSFRLGPFPIIGLSGAKGREVFFENRDLSFDDGYAVLFGQSPQGTKPAELELPTDHNKKYFANRVVQILKHEKLVSCLPDWKRDMKTAIDELRDNASQAIDPFDYFYRLIFRFTIRAVGSNELADDPEQRESTLKCFRQIEAADSPINVMYPWLPTLSSIRRTMAGAKLYMSFKHTVEDRKRTGKREDDALQFLIDQGDSLPEITGFIVGALFAGLINTGNMSSWTAVYLAKNPYWLSKVRDEAAAAAGKYGKEKQASIIEQLSDVPLEAWETEFPMTDLCLRETLRIQIVGTGFRKNVTDKDIPITSNEVVPPGAFVVYAFYDAHFDPSIYTEPEKWDPARYLPDRAEDKKTPRAFAGWGAGRHPCLGMRVAKTEITLLIAFFVSAFDFELVDEHGNDIDPPPAQVNAPTSTPPREKVMFKYRLRE